MKFYALIFQCIDISRIRNPTFEESRSYVAEMSSQIRSE